MSGSGREALLDVREWSEALPDVREWLGDPPGWFGRPFRMFGSGLETLSNVWEWSRSRSECPGVVGKHSRMFGSVRAAIQDVRQSTGGTTGW